MPQEANATPAIAKLESKVSMSSAGKKGTTRSQLKIVFVSGLGFLSDAYDLFVIDLVLSIINDTAFVPLTDSEKGMVGSATLIGSVIGQLGFGFAADFVGRRIMFALTALLCVFGNIASALVGFGYRTSKPSFSIVYQLAIVRFFLGIGIGGEYPLAATVTSESIDETEDRDPKEKIWSIDAIVKPPNSVAAVFSMQGVGLLLSPVIVVIMLLCKMPLEVVWRLLLGIGFIPSLFAFVLRWKMHETTAFQKIRVSRERKQNYTTTTWTKLKNHTKQTGKAVWKFRHQLIGTAMTWFLIDVTFYGTGTFKSSVVRSWYYDENKVYPPGRLNMLDALMAAAVALLAIPGYVLSVFFIHRTGLKRLQIFGFIAVSIAFAVLGGVLMTSWQPIGVLLFLFGLTFLFTNFGANSTTFILPTKIFPSSVRATCHGMSAAMGKAGAALGTNLFPVVKNHWGLDWLLISCAGVSLVGLMFTIFFVPADADAKTNLEKYESDQLFLTKNNI